MRHSGKIRFFKADKGFGFIEADDVGEIFFHISDFARSPPLIVPGETRVSFAVGTGRNGRSAAKTIEVLDD